MEANKKIISKMFDVRPVNESGDLDLEKIEKIEGILRIEEKKLKKSKSLRQVRMEDVRKPIAPETNEFEPAFFEEPEKETKEESFSNPVFVFDYKEDENFAVQKEIVQPETKKEFNLVTPEFKSPEKLTQEVYDFKFTPTPKHFENEYISDNYNFEEFKETRENFPGKPDKKIRIPKIGFRNIFQLNSLKFDYAFAGTALFVILAVSAVVFVGKGLKTKDVVLAEGQSAYANLGEAKEAISKSNFQQSTLEFNEAYAEFESISKSMDNLGGILLEAGRFLPYVSKLTSGKYLSEAGKNISEIGILASGVLEDLNEIKNPLNNSGQSVSFLEIFQKSDDSLRRIVDILGDLENNLSKVNLDDIPEEKREEFAKLKNQLPEIKGFASGFIEDSQIFVDVLGGNGPRKYLFLFQNNNEMRATGGFIGTYGILDIFDGRIRKFYVDGIFNPDGQLREKVVPPKPIQKISAAWSLHDSNWFPNFPVSAEKARWFWEKTGGPTVDGVITMTPMILQKLLGVTGPIEMPEYSVTIDENNFMEKVQEEVEVNYDKELNQPKKILADLAPKILDKLFNERNFSDIAKTMKILSESLNEKQILIYATNLEIEKKLSEKGWSGEILNTQKDYLSVINTNINGYKTDGVVKEKIEHHAQIQDDGTIIDEVRVTRKHEGGTSNYEWFNKVNADYMRVYVPKGSKLISVEGQTREFNSPPLDYDSLGFKKDPQVEMEEQSMQIDDASGTRVYDENEKTVFANWVYVSPQESTTITYKYELPFKINLDMENKLIDTYSLLVQKQAGSLGDDFSAQVDFSDKYDILWKYPDEISITQKAAEKSVNFTEKLNLDRFLGLALTPKQRK